MQNIDAHLHLFTYVFNLKTSYELVALKEAYHRFPSMTSKLNETYKLLASKISCNREMELGEML